MSGKYFEIALLLVLILLSTTRPVLPAHGEKKNEESFDQSIDDFFDRLSVMFSTISNSVLTLFIKIARITYTLTGLVGMLFWASRINRIFGKDLILGALILAIIVESLPILI